MNDTRTLTKAVSFGGCSEISLYNSMGEPVDRNGYKLQSESPEILGEGRTAVVISGDVPSFDSLNVPAALSDYNTATLRELFTASSFGELAFSADEIKTAYDNAPDDTPASSETTLTETEMTLPSETETSPAETSVPESATEETTTTAPFTTVPQTTTTPYTTTTARPTTTAAVTTTAAQTTASETRYVSVYIIIEDEIIAQEVEYGGNASQPSVPEIPGKKFIGWDGDFSNITEETIITAIFEDDPTTTTAVTTVPDSDDVFTTTSDTTFAQQTFTVTVSVNGQLTTQQVPYGGSASLPAVNVPGFTFLGWEGDGSYITSDTTITAILVPDPTYNGTSQTAATVTTPFLDVTL